MENNWGANLVFECSKTKRNVHSFIKFDGIVRTSVPGFCLDRLVASGTEANAYAVDKLTSRNWDTLLVGMGSYVGGDEDLQPYSSSGFSRKQQLSLPKSPMDNTTSALCARQTVALPYHIPFDGMDTKRLIAHEENCLRALHRKLLVATLAGKPFRALLMEFILGGNGGELSKRFLLQLAPLLVHFDIGVVADEVLTSGRVGPDMTVTTGLPTDFSNQVKYITCGKFTACGLVIKRAARKPLAVLEQYRGTTTHFPMSGACKVWMETMARLKDEATLKRRNEVLKAMNVDESNNWGRGCLIFTSKARPSVKQGLKNRLLPMLEPGMKIGKLKTVRTDFTRCAVSESLISVGEKWTAFMGEMDKRDSPFVVELVEYIRSRQSPKFEFTDEMLLEHVGDERAREISQAHKQEHVPNSQKKFKYHMQDATRKAASNAPICKVTGARGLKRARKGKKRKVMVSVDKAILGFMNV